MVAMLSAAPIAGGTAVAPDRLRVVYDTDRLSLSVKEVPLDEALQAVSAETRVAIRLLTEADDAVTMDFAGLTLEEGLKRLLKRYSYSFVYAPAEDSGAEVLAAVIVFAQGAPDDSSEPGVDVGSNPAEPETDPDTAAYSTAETSPADQTVQDDDARSDAAAGRDTDDASAAAGTGAAADGASDPIYRSTRSSAAALPEALASPGAAPPAAASADDAPAAAATDEAVSAASMDRRIDAVDAEIAEIMTFMEQAGFPGGGRF
jgi:hypothetical protein